MKTIRSFRPLLLSLLLLLVLFSATKSSTVETNGLSVEKNRSARPNDSLTFMPEKYRNEALKSVLREANQVAEALQLLEKLPLAETNLWGWYISPPGISRLSGAFGNVTTRNYTYYVSVDHKFSYIESVHQDADRWRWYSEYSWPISRLDTNAAYQLATQWLNAVSMDVNGLNNDCDLHIEPTALRGQGTNAYFLPVYWVYWTKGDGENGSVASVELFAPTRTLMQLRVEQSQYILRKPLQFTNLDTLLPKSVQDTKVPFIHDTVKVLPPVSGGGSRGPFIQGAIKILPPVCFVERTEPADDGGTVRVTIRDASSNTFFIYYDHRAPRLYNKTWGDVYLNADPSDSNSVYVLNQKEFKQKIGYFDY